MSYPSGYLQYAAIQKGLGLKPATNAAKFAARYKFAGQLQSIELLGFSPKANQTYSLALRIALGYSALEQLETLVNRKRIPIKSVPLAQRFKSQDLSKFRLFLINESSGTLRGELENLVSSHNNTDLNSVVRAIRHSMFHGSLNPNRSGLTNKASMSFIEELDRHLFKVMDETFQIFLGEI